MAGRQLGRGLARRSDQRLITHIGAVMGDTPLGAAADWLLRQSGIAPAFGPLPEGVDLGRRAGRDKEVFVVADFAGQRRHVSLPRAMRSLLDGRDGDKLDPAPYGVAVLALQR